MNRGKRPRPLLLFYILVVYVLIQFGWWAFLLFHLNTEVTRLQAEVLKEQVSPQPVNLTTEQIAQQKKVLDEKLHAQWMMVIGEGSVFLLLLVLGFVRTRSSFHKEAALNRQQKNFLLSVTHELKSPIASVKLQLETIQKRSLEKAKQDEMLEHALEDTDRLNGLVENILLAARIDNHAYTVHPEEGDLSATVDDLITKAKRSFARKHQLKTESGENIRLPFDRIGFHSILTNLLENAVKYSNTGSEISVTLKRREHDVRLSVADRGPGIPAGEKENVFRRFYRIGNEETRSTKGTGLGLYIVKYLVDAHGWSIRIDDHPGGGSIFTITIPQI